MPSKTYTVTPEKVASFQTQLGLPAGNSGQFNPPSHPEVLLGYCLVGTALTITILHSAWYESAGMIFDKIDPYFA